MDCPEQIRLVLASLQIPTRLIEKRSLVLYLEADELVVAAISGEGRQHLLSPAAASAWREMHAAAHSEGVSIEIVSAFRSVERQAEILRAKLERGLSLEAILCVSAPPGYSEHHSGRALDVTTDGVAPLEVEFESTPAFRWLSGNAARFGFVLSYPVGNVEGYAYEPWHWCYKELHLLTPTNVLESSYRAFIAELESRGEERIPFPLGFPHDDFGALIARLDENSRGLGLQQAFVPNSTYWLVADSEIVGVSNLRHSLTPSLRTEGGNIGYGVRPSARRKGYGTELLRRTLVKARDIGLSKALITCGKENLGSVKVILANGGRLESEEFIQKRNEIVQRYWIDLQAGVGVEIRELRASDSLEELTALLHAAYAQLGATGLNYTAVDQPVAVTAERIEGGTCYVATIGGRIVGTIVAYPPRPRSRCRYLEKESVALAGQFAVAPAHQRSGIGSRLMDEAENWARERGHSEIAIDTAEPAKHLIEFYARRGYAGVDSVQWDGKKYRSVVMAKKLR